MAAERLREDDRRDWRRHPGDVARLVFRSTVLLAVLGLSALTPAALRAASADLVNLFTQLPATLTDAFVGIAQIAITLIPIAIVGWLLTRRSRAETALVLSGAAAGIIVMLLLTDWLDRVVPPEVIETSISSWFAGTDYPSASVVAGLVAGATVAAPLMPVAWRRAAWLTIGLAVLIRLLTATQAPVNVAVMVALGGVVGSAVLVAFGSPQRRPGAGFLRDELATAGLIVGDLTDEMSRSGRRTYVASSEDGDLHVAYLDRDDRDADLLARFLRTLRAHSVDEDALAVRPQARVAHEGLVTMLSERAGVRVPHLRAVVPTENDSAIIAFDAPPGRALEELESTDLGDVVLDDLWRQLGALHRAGISHRTLTARHIFVDGDSATLTGLGNARLSSSSDQRAVDVAELLVTTARAVGTDRAVASAVRNADRSELEAALAFVQPAALPNTKRADKSLLAEVRSALQDRLGVEEVQLAELQRISLIGLMSWIGFAVLGYFLLTLVSSWSDIQEQLSGIDAWWILPIVLATLCGTLGGSFSLIGSVPRPLPLGSTIIVMFGQSFLNRFTPANAGGMAMRIRYLQKGGTSIASASTAVGLTSAASGVLQVAFIIFFFVWSSTDATEGLGGGGSGPIGPIVLVFVGALVLAVLVVVLQPKLRKRVAELARPIIADIGTDLRSLAGQPAKIGLLFGGAGFAKLSTIFAFVWSCRAFGIDLSFADLGARYLAATTIASAVPTPGGVGAVEAALIFVLTQAGVDQATAWAAVLLFRLINYWMPTAPGYVALKISERRELV